VCLFFQAHIFLKDVRALLFVHDKEFMVIVGPSGCGKSTLLRMIAGLEEITDGNLTIDGKRVNEKDTRDRDLAVVFQN
jgi:multiple sugar transport system ATP-binding protein